MTWWQETRMEAVLMKAWCTDWEGGRGDGGRWSGSECILKVEPSGLDEGWVHGLDIKGTRERDVKDNSTPLGPLNQKGVVICWTGALRGKASFGLKSEMRVLDIQVEKLSRQMWVKDRVLGAAARTRPVLVDQPYLNCLKTESQAESGSGLSTSLGFTWRDHKKVGS